MVNDNKNKNDKNDKKEGGKFSLMNVLFPRTTVIHGGGDKKEIVEMGGGKHKVHTGPRGGKYIVRGGVKVYI